MDSLRGQFLVASPHLPDPHFSRSVVFMLQHEPSGAVGVVLNGLLTSVLDPEGRVAWLIQGGLI